jgi:hypothetical protein
VSVSLILGREATTLRVRLGTDEHRACRATKGEPTTCVSVMQIVSGQIEQVAPQSGHLICGGKFFA